MEFECCKCGCMGVKIIYMDKFAGDPYLGVTCRRCGYFWVEEPLDKKDR